MKQATDFHRRHTLQWGPGAITYLARLIRPRLS